MAPFEWSTVAAMIAAFAALFAAMAAIAQAASTSEQLELAREASRLQARAWVVPYRAELDATDLHHPAGRIWFKNTGTTPALNLRIWISEHICDFPLPHRLDRPPDGFLMSSGVLAPNAEVSMRTEHLGTVPLQNVHLVGTTEGTFYVFGEVAYDDIFGRPHLTKYHYMHGGSQPHPGFSQYIEGNEAT